MTLVLNFLELMGHKQMVSGIVLLVLAGSE